jgi:hypothetical protein
VTFINVAPLTVYSVGTGGPLGGTIATLTVQKTGQYLVAWNNVCNPGGDGHQWVNYSLYVGGVAVAVNIPTALGIGVPSYGGGYWQGHINAGQTVQLTASNPGVGSNGGGTLVAAFIPTPTERN